MQDITLAGNQAAGTTGRFSADNVATASLLGIEIVLDAVGTVFTFTIQGLKLGGNPSIASDWQDVAVLTAKSTDAATATPSVTVATGRNVFYIDGLDRRFFRAIALNVTANTGVAWHANAWRVE